MSFQKLLVGEKKKEHKRFSIYASMKIDVVVHSFLRLPKNDMTTETIVSYFKRFCFLMKFILVDYFIS